MLIQMSRLIGAFRPRRLILVAAILLAAVPAGAERQMLGDEATPSHYAISITPDADAGTFTGSVEITVATHRALPAITLNALDLEIESAAIDGSRAAFSVDPEAQTLTLTQGREIRAGRHRINIAYSGRIYDEAYGLFRVAYDTAQGSRRMLATQFEPGDARRFAPMWDQPNKRAVFALTVTIPSSEQAVSNMPIARTARLSGGRTRISFQPSPSMPSYLLFLGVGDYERISADVDGVRLSVVTRRGESEKGREALQAGVESLRYFTEYFDVPYPLPKLDMIAVPGAGGFGAMENWGAILYFDQYLLLDEGSNETDRQNVFGIVAHEIAHQWFGNLVTMAWWDDLWLNEGFASWMATKAADALHPDWSPWMSVFPDRNSAMELDARAGTHPVVQEVNTIEQANLAFDDITYDKGQAVIRMLEAYIGEEAFRAGIRAYIRARLYGNAATEDLWRALQAASGQPILDVARAYTLQPGFPVISVSPSACAPGAAAPQSVTLTQRRFAADDAARTDELWTTPISAQRLGGIARVQATAPAAASFTLAAPSDGCGPLIVNAGQSAFFRTLYAPADFALITRDFARLPAIDQLGILSDYWAFGRAETAPLTNYLDLTAALSADADPNVVMQAAGALQTLSRLNRGRASEGAFDAYVRAALAPMFARVGWDPRAGEAANDAILRDTLIRVLGRLGDPAIVAEARRRTRADESLPGAIRDAAFRVVGAHATQSDYDALLARAAAETNFIAQRRIYGYLAEARDPALARQTLAMLLTERAPRPLRPTILNDVAVNHPGLAWAFLRDNRATVEGWLDPLRRLDYAPGVAAFSADAETAAELGVYAEAFPANARQAADGARAAILAHARLIETEMPAVDAWLARRSGDAGHGAARR
ncbi:MAG: M1 family metallopeptidase [Hydrogenophilaceae bacterium]|nr:M1 family metallopeptidase [Hydrogenophilaceae bacterium]